MLRRLDRSASNVVAEAGIPVFEDWPECAIECLRPGLRQLLTFGKAPADGGVTVDSARCRPGCSHAVTGRPAEVVGSMNVSARQRPSIRADPQRQAPSPPACMRTPERRIPASRPAAFAA